MKKIRLAVALFFLRLVALLPLRVLYVVSDLMCFLFGRVAGYRKKTVMGNLQRSFPEKSEAELKKIAQGFYRHLCDCIVETVKLLHISDNELHRRIVVRGGDMIERIAADGRPVVVFLGHYGNWEWVQQVTRHYQRPPINAEIYRPIHDKVVDKIMLLIRGRFDTVPIPQHKAVRTLLRMRNEGQQFLVGFISDQRPNSPHLRHWTTFLHQDTAFAAGGEEIGNHLDAHFVFLHVEKPQRGHYEMTFHEMSIDNNASEDYPYTKCFLRLIEEAINKAPEYWLWSHNRWKYDREGNKIH